jgi:hypothetical protein
MSISRRHLGVAGAVALAAPSLIGAAATAETADEAAVGQAVDALTKAMLAADKPRLEALTVEQLSYGHSGGVIQSKAEFVDVIVGKKTIYKSINLLEPSAKVVGPNAIVRHVFTAETEADGKPGSAKVGVLQVWLKQDGNWKLLARQAYRT